MSSSSATGYEPLEKLIGHRFARRELLEQALTHKSYLNENPGEGRRDNERLEFLGDAVLGLVVGDLVMARFPEVREGELSMLRAQVVSADSLADAAARAGLGDWLFLGRGEEQTGGRKKGSLLADAFEAVVGAVYQDAGYEAAAAVARTLLEPRLQLLAEPGRGDFKTRLQERAQALCRETPRYAVVEEHGPDHEKVFVVAVTFGGSERGKGQGRSKKEAEQKAAEAALAGME